MNGLHVSNESLAALFSVDPALWRKEMAEIGEYFAQYGARLPAALRDELAVTQNLLG
jgi:phosphoenolpyruvate carboxykinase (GTP)